MKKNQSPLETISQNFKNLIPYIGVLFVVAGIIGLLFIQQPLQTSQDTRSDASSGNDYILRNCGETCTTNRDCAINLRCYEGECRLVVNPTSPSCNASDDTATEVAKTDETSETKEDTATNSAITKTEPTEDESQKTQDLPKKGDELLSDPDLEFKKQQNALAEKKAYDESYEADETLLDLVRNLILNPESRLPFFIILFGVMLLVVAILAALITRLKKSKSRVQHDSKNVSKKIEVKSYAVKPGEAPRNSAAKDLLKTLENQPKD